MSRLYKVNRMTRQSRGVEMSRVTNEGSVMNMSLYRMRMGESSTALGRVSREGVRLTQSSMEV